VLAVEILVLQVVTVRITATREVETASIHKEPLATIATLAPLLINAMEPATVLELDLV
jgi:hypothetical protein